MFFHVDASGGFLRLQNRLMMNDLKIHGARDVTNSDVPAVLQEEVGMCLLGGAIDMEVPTNSVPFRSLVRMLESLGLL